jgi:hypothetical protein
MFYGGNQLLFFERFDEKDTVAQVTRKVGSNVSGDKKPGNMHSERVEPVAKLKSVHPAELDVDDNAAHLQ